MAAIGHGTATKFSSADAIALAESTPTHVADLPWHNEHGIAAGTAVTITPLDYAFDAVAGELVIATANELAIKRTDERAGEVIVHFPRVGYKLERVAA
jgi:hypothetical protein